MTNILTKKSEIISLDDFINEMNISSELRKFNDDDFKFEVIDDKKNTNKKNTFLEDTGDGDRVYTVFLNKNGEYVLTIKEPNDNEVIKNTFDTADDVAKELSREWLLLFDDIANLLNFSDKKSDAEKLIKLEKKYKELSSKHRKYLQSEYPRRNAERKRQQALQDVITNLIKKIYEIVPDADLSETDAEIEKILKNNI